MSTVLRRNRAFVLLVAAQSVRGVAFWLCWLGMLSVSSFALHATAGQIALIAGATSLPHIVFSPFSGTLVDRTNAKWTLTGALAVNVGIALALLRVTAVWQTYVIAFVWSTAASVVWPSLGSIVKGLVPDADLARANGTLQSAWEVTLIVGPILSGALATAYGLRAPMAVGAVLYAASTGVAAFIRYVPTAVAKIARHERLAHMREGVVLMLRLPDLRALAIWSALAWAGFNVVIAIEPVFIRDYLHGGESMLGAMYAVGGVGSTVGALAIGWLAFARYELRSAAVALTVAGVFFTLYIGIARWPLVLPFQMFIGAGFAIYQTLSVTLIQRRSSHELVGRALAAERGIQETAGLAGSLVAGAVATSAGSRQTMLGACAVMVVAALLMVKASIRHGARRDPLPAVPVLASGGELEPNVPGETAPLLTTKPAPETT